MESRARDRGKLCGAFGEPSPTCPDSGAVAKGDGSCMDHRTWGAPNRRNRAGVNNLSSKFISPVYIEPGCQAVKRRSRMDHMS